MKAKSLLILAGLPIMALISGPVFAADAKTFPGAFCQPSSDMDTLRVIRAQGGLFNNGGFHLWTCPIVRDNTVANTNGILSAFVMAVDQDPSVTGLGIFEAVFCTLNSMTKTGSVYDSASAATNGSNPAAQQLNFANIDASADGYYYLSCSIPSKVNGKMSGILMYKVEEK